MLEESGEASRESASGLDSLGGLLLDSGLGVLRSLLSLGNGGRRLLGGRGGRGLGRRSNRSLNGGGGDRLSDGLTVDGLARSFKLTQVPTRILTQP